MEEETKLESHVVTDFYIEDKQVKSVKASELQTPLKDIIYEVEFEDANPIELTRLKFEAIRTTDKSDATSARDRLVREIGMKMYAIMAEYGVKMSEVDPVLNEVARLVNDNQSLALDLLWGKDMYSRSLLDVNRVLLKKYGSESRPEAEVSDDATASSGSVADTTDSQ